MKICKIRIKDFQQFHNIELDFTDPLTGEPLDKICFIGSNGTGKSTILNFIHSFLSIQTNNFPFSGSFYPTPANTFNTKLSYEVDFRVGNKNYSWTYPIGNTHSDVSFENVASINKVENDKFFEKVIFKYRQSDIIIYSPAETKENKYIQINDVPKTTLNESLKLMNEFPLSHEVSSEKVEIFWKVLITLIKQRENDRIAFETAPKNIDKSKRQLIKEFDKLYPEIMDKLGGIWNKILAKSNLELDTEGVKNPIQLTDNLYAYIRTKDTKERVDYNRLSTGIRNFIFKIGHIYSLYFNREIKRGFLLVDEPENSLYPDFLFDLMETYDEITKDKNGENNTQMFFATHNPIVAAQFEPYQRIVLEWDKGSVKAHKGIAPIGDDPNDILEYDFALKNLMGKKGREKWAEYVNLKKKLIRAKETAVKISLAEQINKIGNAYNFSN